MKARNLTVIGIELCALGLMGEFPKILNLLKIQGIAFVLQGVVLGLGNMVNEEEYSWGKLNNVVLMNREY